MRYFSEEDGAISVEWVLLTAGLVAICLATMSVMQGGLQTATSNTAEELHTYEIATEFTDPNACPEGVSYCTTPNTPWIAGSVTALDGTQFALDAGGNVIDPATGAQLPTTSSLDVIDGVRVTVVTDAAGRVVSTTPWSRNNRVPVDGIRTR
jgi:Flp pilus assembly pilin Flp